jgi:O-antigen/teichoic acid export membrane protein
VTGPEQPGSVAADSLRVLAARVIGNSGYFVSVLLLARALGPADRGTLAFVTVAALVAATIAGGGVGEATKVLAASRPQLRARLLSNLAVLAVAGSAAGVALTCGALAALPGARPDGVGALELVLLGLGIVATAVAVGGMCFLQGCGRFRAYTRIAAAAPWLYALLLVALWRIHGLTVAWAAGAWVVAQAALGLALAVASARGVGFSRPDPRLLRETVAFGVRAWVGGVSHFLNARVDQLLLGMLATEAALGVYAVAVNASEVLFYLASATGTALVPAVARDGSAAGPERTVRVFRAVALVTLAGVALAALIGPALLPLLFGDAYRASVGPFLLLLPSALGFAANAIFTNALLGRSLPALSSLGPAVAFTVGVVLDLVLIPRHGASGAAVAASVALLSGGLTAAIAYRVRVGLPLRALLPRRADLGTLARLARHARRPRASRRAGASPS